MYYKMMKNLINNKILIFVIKLHGEPYSLTIIKGDAPVVITQEKENIKIDHSDNLGKIFFFLNYEIFYIKY